MRFFTPRFAQFRYVLRDSVDARLLREGKLSEHFALSEFTRSATARRHSIDNTPPEEAIQALNLLVDNVLEPARVALGWPLRVTSGYRSPKLNRKVKGARNSDHVFGRAADVEVIPETKARMFALGRWIQENCEFKQLIWEYGGEWIHVAYDPEGNRKEVLEAVKVKNWRGKFVTKYQPFTFLG